MMTSPFYLLSTVCSVAGLWFVWDLGLKKLILDIFRERLFELRFKLFKLAADGDLSFEDDAYRAVETLLCGLLRFAHRVTLMSFLLSVRNQAKAKEDKEFVDYHQQIELKVSRTSYETREKINEILKDTQTAVTIYMAVSSLSFIAVSIVYLLLKPFNLLKNNAKEQVSHVVESEVYRLEAYQSIGHNRKPAAAMA